MGRRPPARPQHADGQRRVPLGQRRRASGTCKLKDGVDGSADRPGADVPRAATTTSCRSRFDDFGDGGTMPRGVPVRRLDARRRRRRRSSTTVYDLLMAQYGVPRGLRRRLSRDYDDDDRAVHAGVGGASTPAWAATTLIRFAREWGDDRRADRRQVHDHHRRRHQPLVPRQPDVPRRRSTR